MRHQSHKNEYQYGVSKEINDDTSRRPESQQIYHRSCLKFSRRDLFSYKLSFCNKKNHIFYLFSLVTFIVLYEALFLEEINTA